VGRALHCACGQDATGTEQGEWRVATTPTFHIVPGSTVKRIIDENREGVSKAVAGAYRLHASGETVNPDSYFLRYRDNPTARIIALPAHIGGAVQKSGIKWIASFPENRLGNLARASAVLILNDARTGYPLACIEGSLISATRTAASAALAAEHLCPLPFEGTLSVIGTGALRTRFAMPSHRRIDYVS
jgi:ornithine cyclodeaminase